MRRALGSLAKKSAKGLISPANTLMLNRMPQLALQGFSTSALLHVRLAHLPTMQTQQVRLYSSTLAVDNIQSGQTKKFKLNKSHNIKICGAFIDNVSAKAISEIDNFNKLGESAKLFAESVQDIYR